MHASIAKHISEEGSMCGNKLHWLKFSGCKCGDVYIANIYASNKLHEHIEMWETMIQYLPKGGGYMDIWRGLQYGGE